MRAMFALLLVLPCGPVCLADTINWPADAIHLDEHFATPWMQEQIADGRVVQMWIRSEFWPSDCDARHNPGCAVPDPTIREDTLMEVLSVDEILSFQDYWGYQTELTYRLPQRGVPVASTVFWDGRHLKEIEWTAEGFPTEPAGYYASQLNLVLSIWSTATPIPEPSTWALLLCGLAVIALLATRRP